MCRAISFFSMSNDAQFESGAIQDTRILTGSAFDAPWAKSEIAATSPIDQDRTSRICPSHAGPARKLTIATFADKPQRSVQHRQIPCYRLSVPWGALQRIRKFPVPLRREFGWKLLDLRFDPTRNSGWMAGFGEIPY